MANFSIKVNLLKLTGAFLTNFKGNTTTKRCVVIPIDDSNLFLGEKDCTLTYPRSNSTSQSIKNRTVSSSHSLKRYSRR